MNSIPISRTRFSGLLPIEPPHTARLPTAANLAPSMAQTYAYGRAMLLQATNVIYDLLPEGWHGRIARVGPAGKGRLGGA